MTRITLLSGSTPMASRPTNSKIRIKVSRRTRRMARSRIPPRSFVRATTGPVGLAACGG
jgi:hypothetical protein